MERTKATRSEAFAAVAALLVLVCTLVAMFASCGGNDLVLGGSGIVTPTSAATATATQ
jgi:hypothetical protein